MDFLGRFLVSAAILNYSRGGGFSTGQQPVFVFFGIVLSYNAIKLLCTLKASGMT
jgi:hypothetical protein